MGAHPDDLPEEMLMAYADGELNAEDRRRVEAYLEHSPEQRARLAPYLMTREPLSKLIGEAVPEPVPQRLIDAINQAPLGRDSALSAQPASRGRDNGVVVRLRRALVPHASAVVGNFALAASIVATAGIGYLAATLLAAPGADMRTAGVAPGVRASGPLAVALEKTPSAQVLERGGARVKVLLSFKDKAGRYCRQYEMADAADSASAAGYACRQGQGEWGIGYHTVLEGTDIAAAPSNEAITPAGDGRDAALEKAIDARIAGSVLEADEEARLIARNWTAP